MIPKHAYNPSLCRFKNRLLMSYRYHNKDWRTNLGLCELDSALSPISCKPILPPSELKDNAHEDCRLLVHQDKLLCSWTVSQWPATEFRAVVAFGELVEGDESWRIANYYLPHHGKNDFSAVEKNWLFFSRHERLWCLYLTHNDEQVILQMEGGRVEEVIRSKALRWPYAQIHGGAICDGENGNLLHFFNSHTEKKDRLLHFYRIGVGELSGQPPFDMLRISSRALVAGEEGVRLDKNPFFKSNVVFCCGAVPQDGDWLVSYGHNDCQCRIAKVTKEDLRL